MTVTDRLLVKHFLLADPQRLQLSPFSLQLLIVCFVLQL